MNELTWPKSECDWLRNWCNSYRSLEDKAQLGLNDDKFLNRSQWRARIKPRKIKLEESNPSEVDKGYIRWLKVR